MIKKIAIIFVLIVSLNCERDDICIDPTTPKLLVVFYDNTNQTERKAVSNLKIEVESTDGFVEITHASNDSIAIPLRVDIDLTKIKLIKKETDQDEIIDEFTLNYVREEVFVSRSCGYKTIYPQTTQENLTQNWIASLTINNQNVTDETAKHISIFH